MCAGKSAVFICCNEETVSVAGKVLEGFGQLGIVDSGIQTAYDRCYIRVKCEVAQFEGL